MKTVVILQPMFFPWVGHFEQIRLADVFVHFEDVQLPQGRSFTTRVQVKTSQGSQWLTVPVKHGGSRLIKDVLLDDGQDWRRRHIRTLEHSYARAPFGEEMLSIVRELYEKDIKYLAELNILAIERIAEYFGLPTTFLRSTAFPAESHSSQRLLDILLQLRATNYVTGHGARNYLDHELFDRHGIRVDYMDYRRAPYPQMHGPFDPHVSILDLIANVGSDGVQYIHSPSKYWKQFLCAPVGGVD